MIFGKDLLITGQKRGKYFRNTMQEFQLGLDFNFLEFETSSIILNLHLTSILEYHLIRFDALHYPIGINEAQAYGKDNDLALPITVGIKMKPLNSFVVGLEISAKHSSLKILMVVILNLMIVVYIHKDLLK